MYLPIKYAALDENSSVVSIKLIKKPSKAF